MATLTLDLIFPYPNSHTAAVQVVNGSTGVHDTNFTGCRGWRTGGAISSEGNSWLDVHGSLFADCSATTGR